MRVMQSDLAILNAAQYGDGLEFEQSLKAPPPARGGHGPKKRPRVLSDDESTQVEPEEEKKRSRGRPRLDPTDQTPQDVSPTHFSEHMARLRFLHLAVVSRDATVSSS